MENLLICSLSAISRFQQGDGDEYGVDNSELGEYDEEEEEDEEEEDEEEEEEGEDEEVEYDENGEKIEKPKVPKTKLKNKQRPVSIETQR